MNQSSQTPASPTAPLIDWLLRQYPDTPKTRAKQWILAGRVQVHGQIVRKPHQVMPDPGNGLDLGDRRASTLDCGKGWQIHPRVTLLHLDGALAIVNKGPGLISVPAENSGISALSILADFLAGRLKPQDRAIVSKTLPQAYRQLEPLPVHRLDQYTSGVFCIAMNPQARRKLIEQLPAHEMKREYVAFAEGRATEEKGTWRNFLQLSRDELRQYIVSDEEARLAGDEAREAVTHFEVLAEYPLKVRKGFVTKLRLRLESGRKHQIRAQAAYAGLPLVGDRTYHPGYHGHEAVDAIQFTRQALHAEVLSLLYPDQTNRRLSWTAQLPKDLRELETDLRAGRL